MAPQPEWGVKISKFFILPQRIILSIMGFFSILVAYTARVSISVAIIELVPNKNFGKPPSELDSGMCPPWKGSGKAPGPGGPYKWSEELQGRILSSFYIGYLLTHVPGGIIADKFGGKWTLSGGLCISTICCLISPLAIRKGGPHVFILTRILMGCGQGVVFPALSTLLSAWIPKKERTTLGSFVMGGGQLGTVVTNSISGILLDAFEWDFTFYFFGSAGAIWFVIFIFLCYSSPDLHPFIKQREKDYLEQEMGQVKRKGDLPPTPWKAIFTNPPMLAQILAQIGHDWGFYVMVTDLPKYMADVMNFPIKENGLYTSLPYLVMWIFSLTTACLSDWIIARGILSITNSRKVFTSISKFLPATFIVAASYAGCSHMLVVVLFTIAMGTMGAYYAGMKLTPLDLSPNYSGTLMAISNGMGSITGVLSPYFVGVMTPNSTLLEWRLVFWVAFAMMVSTCFVYIIWASGEVQPFNDPKPKEEE